MRTEVKIGLFAALVIIIGGGVIWGLNRGGKVADVVPMDAPAGPMATPAGKADKAETPKTKPGDGRQAAPAKTPPVTPPVAGGAAKPAGNAAVPPTKASPAGAPGSPVAPRATGTPPSAPPTGKPLTTTPPPASAPHVTPISPPVVERPPTAPPESPGVLPPLVVTPEPNRPSADDGNAPTTRPAPAEAAPSRSPGVSPPPRKEPETPLTPTPGPTTPASRSPAAGAAKYVVQEGESLWTIAEEKLGDGHLWPKIKAANPGIDENKIAAGQVLMLPSKEDAAAAEPKPGAKPGEPKNGAKPGEAKPETKGAAAETKPDAGARTYIVEDGDTLMRIAKKILGSPGQWQRILDLNKDKLSKPEDLKAGMEIRLPPAKEAKPPTTTTKKSGR